MEVRVVRPKKVDEQLKDQRIALMMSKRELELIDDWMFAHRIRSRGEAIRAMCMTVIVKDKAKIKDAEFKRHMDSAAEENAFRPSVNYREL
jgi:hypothetical protein